MKASEKRKAAQQRNIDAKQAKRHEAALIRQAQAEANDTELKALCARIAILQVRHAGEKPTVEAIHARARQVYKAFRALPAARQPEAWEAGQRYVKSGGNVSEFLNFGGMTHGGGGQAKLEEHPEQT